MRHIHLAVASALFALLLARPALAAWPNQSVFNLPVCTEPSSQYPPTMVSDGAGGAIVVWQDGRAGGIYDIYAQHVLAEGATDPVWPVNGLAICTAAGNQSTPAVVSDDDGGAIVTWQDDRGQDIYAQHVLASGTVDPLWPSNGRALCAAFYIQGSPTIVSDGRGGAIVAWYDLRTFEFDIYAQHVLASGMVDPLWPSDGRALCTAVSDQAYQVIESDGSGGAIVAWADFRSGLSYDIVAQHVLGTGAVDPSWPVDGRFLCAAGNNQTNPVITSDGSGGAIVGWTDNRNSNIADVYAQHVLASGTVDPAWPPDGRAICTAASHQNMPSIVPDGTGGAIVAWNDSRSGISADIYAQRVLAFGTVDPAWPSDGRSLCAAVGNQTLPRSIPDGAGGAIIAWQDSRSGASTDIYAHHVLPSGAVDLSWPSDGRAVSTAAGNQQALAIVSDGQYGAILAWQDARGGATYDIYAQRVARYGYLGSPEGVIASVRDVPNDQGGRVKVSWNAAYLEAEPFNYSLTYHVFRSIPPTVAQSRLASGASTRSGAEPASPNGEIMVVLDGAETLYWELLGSVASMNVPGYSYYAPTTGDSVAGSNPLTAFMIQTRNSTQYWNSKPLSGYSVDNLAPVAPALFVGTYAAGTAALHWSPNAEADVAEYRVYRGTTTSFVPGDENLVMAQADTGYVDPVGAPYYYKLVAVDVHGNVSPTVLALPLGALAVEAGLPADLAFAGPAPNPARGATVLRFALPRDASVRLALYDVSGRRVRMLVQGERAAGEHNATWDLRDDAGRVVGAGFYFARLDAEGRTFTQRVMTLR